MNDIESKIVYFIEKKWRPKVQADGGEIRFVSYVNNTVTVKFLGECARCNRLESSSQLLHSELKREFSNDLMLKSVVEKPYFAR